LKGDDRTRVIPVHVVSGRDRDPALLLMGAAAYLKKPVLPEDLNQVFDTIARFEPARPRRVLVVEDDPAARAGIRKLLGGVTCPSLPSQPGPCRKTSGDAWMPAPATTFPSPWTPIACWP
jgi:CheY-like chemotaxis protein